MCVLPRQKLPLSIVARNYRRTGATVEQGKRLPCRQLIQVRSLTSHRILEHHQESALSIIKSDPHTRKNSGRWWLWQSMLVLTVILVDKAVAPGLAKERLSLSTSHNTREHCLWEEPMALSRQQMNDQDPHLKIIHSRWSSPTTVPVLELNVTADSWPPPSSGSFAVSSKAPSHTLLPSHQVGDHGDESDLRSLGEGNGAVYIVTHGH